MRALDLQPVTSAPEGLAPDIDPVAFELINNAMTFLVNEMALTLVRASYSGILRDNMDFATAVADPDGQMGAQGLSLPLSSGPCPMRSPRSRRAGRGRWSRATCSS